MASAGLRTVGNRAVRERMRSALGDGLDAYWAQSQAMGVALKRDQYALRWLEIVIEDRSTPTDHVCAPGFATTNFQPLR